MKMTPLPGDKAAAKRRDLWSRLWTAESRAESKREEELLSREEIEKWARAESSDRARFDDGRIIDEPINRSYMTTAIYATSGYFPGGISPGSVDPVSRRMQNGAPWTRDDLEEAKKPEPKFAEPMDLNPRRKISLE